MASARLLDLDDAARENALALAVLLAIEWLGRRRGAAAAALG